MRLLHPQNLLIRQVRSEFQVVGEIGHETLFASSQAHLAIQAAIDALAGTGGQVKLGPGTYPLAAEVKLANDIHLRGSGRGTKLLVCKENDAKVGLLCKGLHGATILELAVVAEKGAGAAAGIVVDDSGECKVRDVFCAGFDLYGIWMRNNAFLCEIRGCSLAGNRGAGILLENLERSGRYGDFVPNLVTNCTVYGGGKGIECVKTIVLNIVACVVYQTNDVAYSVLDYSNSVLISGCRSFQIGSHAVVVENSHELNLSSNVFCWHTGHGILVNDAFWGTICGNEVIDNGSYNTGCPNGTGSFDELAEEPPTYDGIHLEGTRGYSITGNTIFNWSVAPKINVGIHEDASSHNNTIVGNNINYFEDDGVVSLGKDSKVSANVSFGDEPYDDEGGRRWSMARRRIQSFQVELTERFIAEQVGE